MKSSRLLPLLALTLAGATARAHLPPLDAKYKLGSEPVAFETR